MLCHDQPSNNRETRREGPRDGIVVFALASHLCGPGSGHEWVKLVVGSLVCSESFFSGFSGFPLSSKINLSKFQFDPMLDLPKQLMGEWSFLGKYH